MPQNSLLYSNRPLLRAVAELFISIGRREQNLQKLKNLSVTSVTRIVSLCKLSTN